MSGERTDMVFEAEQILETVADLETKAAHWLAVGNAASERGNLALAERHYARSQKWLDRATAARGWQ
jgi:hypothetical protein